MTDPMKILITGAGGMLGTDLGNALSQEFEIVGLERRPVTHLTVPYDICDLTQARKTREAILSHKPEMIIHTAAMTDVDYCEEHHDEALENNVAATEHVIDAANEIDAAVIFYSTDYVFDGKKGELYTEDDAPNPLNVYGKSKLAGEEAVQKHAGSFLLFRTSWVFGNGPQNFIYKFRQWSQKSRVIKLSADEVSVPTSSADLVSVTLTSLEKGLKGLHHLTNSGYASRYELGRYVAKVLSLDNLIIPVPMSTFPSTLQRPAFTAMSNARLQKHLGLSIRDWRSAVDLFFKEYPPQ